MSLAVVPPTDRDVVTAHSNRRGGRAEDVGIGLRTAIEMAIFPYFESAASSASCENVGNQVVRIVYHTCLLCIAIEGLVKHDVKSAPIR